VILAHARITGMDDQLLPAPPPDSAVLDRYFAGEASEAEHLAVHRWLAIDPETALKLGELENALAGVSGHEPLSSTVVPLWTSRILEQSPLAGSSRRRTIAVPSVLAAPRMPATIRWFAAVAAVVLVVATMWRLGPRSARIVGVEQSRSFVTAAGQRATMTVAPGMDVVLGPSTTLRVTTTVAGITADLRGAALFSVIPKSSQMIEVRTSNATARVLGTTFALRQYPTETATRLAVGSGRVSFAADGESARATIVAAGQLALASGADNVRLIAGASIDADTAWASGRLVFRDTPLREVIAELSRVYGVDVMLSDSSLANQQVTYTATTATRSLIDVLDVVAPIANAHYTRVKQRFILYAGRRLPPVPRSIRPSSSIQEPQYGK
jgi:transmembrane sensor